MITRENYYEPFELFHPKQVVLLSEVCGVKPELNKSCQPATLGRLFIFLSWGSVLRPVTNLIKAEFIVIAQQVQIFFFIYYKTKCIL